MSSITEWTAKMDKQNVMPGWPTPFFWSSVRDWHDPGQALLRNVVV